MPEIFFINFFPSKFAVQYLCCKLVHVYRIIKDSKICLISWIHIHSHKCLLDAAKLIQGLAWCLKGHTDCGCLWWFRSLSWIEEDGKEENYTNLNICIYVPIWSNIRNQLQDCILDSHSHFQTGALDCDIIRFRPSINQKFDKYRKSCRKQYLLFFLNKEPVDMKTEEATGDSALQLISLFFLLYRYTRGEEIFILRIYELKTKKCYAIKLIRNSFDRFYTQDALWIIWNHVCACLCSLSILSLVL